MLMVMDTKLDAKRRGCCGKQVRGAGQDSSEGEKGKGTSISGNVGDQANGKATAKQGERLRAHGRVGV